MDTIENNRLLDYRDSNGRLRLFLEVHPNCFKVVVHMLENDTRVELCQYASLALAMQSLLECRRRIENEFDELKVVEHVFDPELLRYL